MKFLLLIFFLLINLNLNLGCQFLRSNDNSYPQEISLGSSKTYPSEIGEFKRQKSFIYGPNNTSTGYNLFDSDNQISVTVYSYKSNFSFIKLFETEKNIIARSKKDASKVLDTKNKLIKDGKTYFYSKAAFTAEENFAGKDIKIYTELFLFQVKDKFIKIRMTTPFDQKKESEKLTHQFINKLDWN